MTVDVLEEKALSLPEVARGMAVVDEATLALAGIMLTEQIKPLLKEANETFDPVIQAAHETHRSAISAKKKVTEPLLAAESILKSSVSIYLTDRERKRKAEADRLEREEAERRAAESERLRLEAEARHALEVEAQLDALPIDTPPEVVAEIANQAAPAPEMPVYRPAPVAARVVAPAGISMRTAFKAEVSDLRALCLAIGQGKQPVSYVSANMPALNQAAKAMREGFAVPGCRAVQESSVAARGR